MTIVMITRLLIEKVVMVKTQLREGQEACMDELQSHCTRHLRCIGWVQARGPTRTGQ